MDDPKKAFNSKWESIAQVVHENQEWKREMRHVSSRKKFVEEMINIKTGLLRIYTNVVMNFQPLDGQWHDGYVQVLLYLEESLVHCSCVVKVDCCPDFITQQLCLVIVTLFQAPSKHVVVLFLELVFDLEEKR